MKLMCLCSLLIYFKNLINRRNMEHIQREKPAKNICMQDNEENNPHVKRILDVGL